MAPIVNVPREVLFIIADQLPDLARLALSLTCKRFFASLNGNGRLPKLFPSETRSLLSLLQRDFRDFYLCFGCNRLQSFDPNSDGKLPHPYCGPKQEMAHEVFWPNHHGIAYRVGASPWDLPLTVQTPSRFIWKPHPAYWQPKGQMQMNGPDGKWPEIEFSQAQLVMNRHFFGEHTGLPIESLHKTFEFERTIPPAGLAVPESHFPLENHPEMTHWKFSHDYSARIMNDELLVSRSHLVSASVCSLTEFLRVIDALELPVCGHIYAATRRPYLPFETFWVDKNGSIPELFEMWLESTQEAPGTKRVYTHGTLGDGACKTCFTDYLLKAEPGDRDGHWHLNLTTYHNLGSCQDPNDPKWHCLTMSSEAAFRRSKLKRRYSNGVGENVFFQWHGITNIQAKSNHQGEDGSDIEDDGDVEDGRVNEDRIKYQTEWARHRARFVEPFAVEVSQTMIGRGGLNYRHIYAVEIAQSLASGNIA